MGAPKGHEKWGGKPLGFVGKVKRDLLSKCEERGIDVFDEMLKIAMNENNDIALRGAMLKECAQYLYPKRKAIEVSTEAVNPYANLSDAEKLEKAKQAVALLEARVKESNETD